MLKKISSIAICLLLASFTSCKKAEAGPQGEPGPQGAQGAPGNANVITTSSVQPSSWSFDADGDIYSTSITHTALTQAVMDKGLVMVYVEVPDEGWVPLPYVGLSSPTDFLTFIIQKNLVKITYYDTTDPTENPSSFGLAFKVVIVPAAMVKPNINHLDYSEVSSAYSISN